MNNDIPLITIGLDIGMEWSEQTRLPRMGETGGEHQIKNTPFVYWIKAVKLSSNVA